MLYGDICSRYLKLCKQKLPCNSSKFAHLKNIHCTVILGQTSSGMNTDGILEIRPHMNKECVSNIVFVTEGFQKVLHKQYHLNITTDQIIQKHMVILHIKWFHASHATFKDYSHIFCNNLLRLSKTIII